MKTNAVPQEHVKSPCRSFSLFLSLALVASMSLALAGSAVAAPAPGQDGKVHACYRVKGKAKGAMRVVPANRKCRRGERQLAWDVGSTASTGAQGTSGAQGSQGSPGAVGTAGANGSAGPGVATLETKIVSLTSQVGVLEKVLEGVDDGELSNVLATLGGLDNEDLTKAVDSVPALNSLCTQASLLTGGLNSLNSGIDGLAVLGLPGLSLGTSSLPAALSPYACPAH